MCFCSRKEKEIVGKFTQRPRQQLELRRRSLLLWRPFCVHLIDGHDYKRNESNNQGVLTRVGGVEHRQQRDALKTLRCFEDYGGRGAEGLCQYEEA